MEIKTSKTETSQQNQGYPIVKPLGRVLRKAGLISKCQIRLALRDQKIFSHLRFGDILVLRGWVQQETVDFFAEDWPKLIQKRGNKPLGFYLKSAGFITDLQIQEILKEQTQTGLRFGAIAVIKGWVKQETIDFFLIHIAPQERSQSPFIRKQQQPSESSQVLYVGDAKITVPDHKPASDKLEAEDTELIFGNIWKIYGDKNATIEDHLDLDD